MKYFFENLKNNFDFFMRNSLSRRNYKEKAQDLSDIFENGEQKSFYNNLNNRYNLDILKNSTKRNFLENLYFLDVFDKYFSKNSCDDLSILDIGSKNWNYAKSEFLFFNSFSKHSKLNGIELDAYRLNNKLYNRYEIAKFHIKDLKNTNYIIGDLLEHNYKYNYIIWILPFVTEYPLVKWGLPLRYFKPQKMLSFAYNLLKENGEMLIINQGEKEYIIQQNLIKELKISAKHCGEIPDVFNLFQNKRFCTIIKNLSER